MPIKENIFSAISYKEFRPGRYAKFRNGKFVSIATDEEIYAYLETEGYIESLESEKDKSIFEIDNEKITFHDILQIYGRIAQNLTRQLMFIASILAGFIFTIIYDLVTTTQNANDVLLSLHFSLLLISGFSFLISIVISGILQFAENIEYLSILKNKDKLGMPFSKATEESGEAMELVEPILVAFAWSSIGALTTFLLGILCFVISITILGWLRSIWFGFLSTALMLLLIFTTLYLVRKFFSAIQQQEV
jgi:hypothetical protein